MQKFQSPDSRKRREDPTVKIGGCPLAAAAFVGIPESGIMLSLNSTL